MVKLTYFSLINPPTTDFETFQKGETILLNSCKNKQRMKMNWFNWEMYVGCLSSPINIRENLEVVLCECKIIIYPTQNLKKIKMFFSYSILFSEALQWDTIMAFSRNTCVEVFLLWKLRPKLIKMCISVWQVPNYGHSYMTSQWPVAEKVELNWIRLKFLTQLLIQ